MTVARVNATGCHIKVIRHFKGYDLADASAKLVIYGAFIEEDLDVPKHLTDDVHRHYSDPEHEEFKPRTMGSLSNAFTSAFKQLDPVRAFAMHRETPGVASMFERDS